ncbi:hypothetical protein G9C98_004783 [Cotesia typhae]|uniref:Uncharacterized protein n=1 Tax=Cotesia typhae TaxID=2053667 RepID=A0A8J5R1X8_9HYME|nr:hypothetical protein G9C98_004783 [Cotesia typhae]
MFEKSTKKSPLGVDSIGKLRRKRRRRSRSRRQNRSRSQILKELQNKQLERARSLSRKRYEKKTQVNEENVKNADNN